MAKQNQYQRAHIFQNGKWISIAILCFAKTDKITFTKEFLYKFHVCGIRDLQRSKYATKCSS